MSDAQAAALYLTYQTGYVGLHRRAALQAGEWLLVHAGAGGVGTAAIQLGKAAGATGDRHRRRARRRPRCAPSSAPTTSSTTRPRTSCPGQGDHRRARGRRRLRPGRRRRLRRIAPSASPSRAGSSSSASPPAGSRRRRPTTCWSRTTRVRRPALGPVPQARTRPASATVHEALCRLFADGHDRPADRPDPAAGPGAARRWPRSATAAPSARSSSPRSRPAVRCPACPASGVRRPASGVRRPAMEPLHPLIRPGEGAEVPLPRASDGGAGR